MTDYEKLLGEFAKYGLDMTRSALEREIRAERDALLDNLGKFRGKRTPKLVADAEREAAEFYARDIMARVEGRNPRLTPTEVLGHRRAPTAWAVAARIRESRRTYGKGGR